LSYSGFASGIASMLITLHKLADSRVEDFPSMTTDIADVELDSRCTSLSADSKISVDDSTDLPGQDRLVSVTLGKRQRPNNQLLHTDS